MMILSASTVNAEGLKAYKSRTKMIVHKVEVDVEDQTAVAVVYTPDKKIFSAARAFIKDGKADLKLLYPETPFTFKLYTDIGSDTIYSLPCNEVTAIEDIEQIENEFVPVYGDTAAAIGAFAVVKDIEEKLNEIGDAVASIQILYRGSQTEIQFETDYKLDNIAQGGTISVLDLEAGDVLKLDANLSGKLYGADLIFRAPKTDSVLDSEEVSKIYTSVADEEKMSVFGIIGDKFDDTMVLYNAGGLEADALYLDLDPNTVVYCYDENARKEKVTVASVGEIYKSEVNSSDKDEYDNIINWDIDSERVYAYVRVYDGIVCDVLMFVD
jgi:hypothetical protein